jgi:hypothetical protein
MIEVAKDKKLVRNTKNSATRFSFPLLEDAIEKAKKNSEIYGCSEYVYHYQDVYVVCSLPIINSWFEANYENIAFKIIVHNDDEEEY